MNARTDVSINLWRQHIIEGLLKARRDAGRVIETLNFEDNPKQCLMEKLSFSEAQAQSILELRGPLDEIEEELLVAEQLRLKVEEAELKRRTDGNADREEIGK